jgi:ribosome-associated protein
MAELIINNRIHIPLSECEFTFARSGGPGGQNVNKVNSKAILRWSASNSPNLPADVKERFFCKYSNRITIDGDIILTSQKYRDQSRNIDNCLEKLTEMITAVAVPKIQRRATKPTFSSKLKRTETKRQHSIKKEYRRKPALDN